MFRMEAGCGFWCALFGVSDFRVGFGLSVPAELAEDPSRGMRDHASFHKGQDDFDLSV